MSDEIARLLYEGAVAVTEGRHADGQGLLLQVIEQDEESQDVYWIESGEVEVLCNSRRMARLSCSVFSLSVIVLPIVTPRARPTSRSSAADTESSVLLSNCLARVQLVPSIRAPFRNSTNLRGPCRRARRHV